MKRIRLVEYYRCDEVPASWRLAKLIGRFLAEELRDDRLLTPAIPRILWEKCLQALTAGVRHIEPEDVSSAIAGPLAGSNVPPASTAELTQKATDALNRVLLRLYQYLGDHFLEARGTLEMWSIGEALMPFTDTSLPTLVRVRRCWCDCWVLDGSANCPFCGWDAPAGRSRRAWIREQIRIQQPADGGGAPPNPGGRTLPPDLSWDDINGAAGRQDDQDFELETTEPIDWSGEGELEDNDA